MRNKLHFLLTLALLTIGMRMVAQETYSGYTVAQEGAWCWFADPRAIHYENASGSINMSYLGYIDVHGNIKATQYDWLTGRKSDVLVRSYFQPDDHNNPTFLVLPDERVLIIYSRHTDEAAFYYRVSVRPGDISQLGEEKKIVTANNTTYPSPFLMSDDPTHWYLCWRGISWHPTIARLTLPDENDNVTFDWGPYQMVQSTGARPYAKYYSNGKDKIYVTYTTGHPDNESPNWVYFNVININGGGEPTLEDIKGNTLSTIKNGTFAVSKTDNYKSSYPYTVVNAPSNGIRDWVWQIALDDDQKPCIAMVQITSDKSQHEYYYAKWTGSSWRLTDLADGGGKFHSSSTEYCYSGGEALDQQNPKTIYLSIPTTGTHGSVFELWKYTLDSNGKVTTKEQVTQNSEKNNVRPFLMPNSQGSPMRLAWMNGDYYYWIVKSGYPLGYPTRIQCDYDWQEKAEATEGWTLNRSITMDANNYTGVTLLTEGGITYGVDANAYPYVKINGTTYRSQNKLYTSDNWATNSSGTSGDNWPTQLSQWMLSMTYDGTTLTTYRNGLIDQKITLSGIEKPEDASEGCLTQAQLEEALEVSTLSDIQLPTQTATDVVLPTKVNGYSITWTSNNEEILASDGTFRAPEKETEVTLCATSPNASALYTIKCLPRDLKQNLLASYDFSDTKDQSGRGNDLTLCGSAQVNGVLDLTANTASAFSTNGYALVPAGVMDSLRSYSILFEATPKSVTNAPRFYDFGLNNGNSLFCRVNGFCAGIKYAGGTTTMTNSTETLVAGKTYKIAVTFDAKTKTTCIYVDGVLAGTGIENQNEPYMIALQGSCSRNYIGRTQWWDSSVASSNVDYQGTLDNLKIFNIRLTQKEVCQEQDLPFEVDGDKTTFDNGDFEGSYSVMSGSGVSSDRAIYVPEGWTVAYLTRDANDLTALKSGDLYYSQFFGSLAQPTEGGSQTYWIRQRWGASVIDLNQVVLLPEGKYTLTADIYASAVGGTNVAKVYVDEKEKSPSVAGQWQTVTFDITTDGTAPVQIGLEAYHTANEFICGFDNFRLTKVVPDAVTRLQTDNSTQAFDLSGRPATPGRGIVIRNGKKIVK